MQEHHLITDWYSMQPRLHEQGSRIEPEVVALSLRQMALAVGGSVKLHALVSDQDDLARKAFDAAGFRIWSVNGNRQKELDRMAEEVEDRVIGKAADRLTLVTTDPALEKLARRATKMGCQVRVWGTNTSTPGALRQYSFQPLEELLPELRVKRVVVLVDWENISIGLSKAGWEINPETVAEAFKLQASRYGSVHAVYAYADWGALSRGQSQDVQRLLEMSGVATRYEVSMRGKSSSDMRIIDKAHKLLQGSDAPDVLVLASGDRDFRALIETARKRFGKTVVLWGKRGNVSPMVSEAANEVEWIDDFLPLPRRQDLDSISRGVRRPKNALVDPHIERVLKIEGLLRSRGWEWISPGKLLDDLAASDDPHARSIISDWIYQAQADKVLLSEQKPNPHPDAARSTVDALSLNSDHPSAKAARLIISRAQDRVRYALQVRRMPYVTFSYIANGMGMDTELKKAGLAKTREEQMHWLDLLVEAGLLVKERRSSPQPCTVLWLPQEKPAQAKNDSRETMLRRLISNADAFAWERGMDWAPVKWLHQNLRRYGDQVFQETLTHLTESGETETRYHQNPNGSHQTLGLHLDPKDATVAATRGERERILKALRQAGKTDQPLSLAGLQTQLKDEIQADICEQWVKVLVEEGALLQQGNGYQLNHKHALVMGLPESENQSSQQTAQSDRIQRVAGETPGEKKSVAQHDTPQEELSGGETQVTLIEVESGTLRQIVTDTLSDDELTALTYDSFRQVYEKFAEGMPKSKKVHLLIEHVQRKRLVQLLLDEVSKLNPASCRELVPQDPNA